MVKRWDPTRGEYEDGEEAAPAAATATMARDERRVFAHDGAMAWLNAAIASGQDDERPALYRTLRVEFFRRGVQFIGCDGTTLFRTWAPYSDIGDLPAPQPEPDEAPEDAVTVADVDRFALAFMRTLLSATTGDNSRIIELSLSIDPVEGEQAPLSGELGEYALTLQAVGQRLSCRLWDGRFPDWRALDLGLDAAELVDGMTLAPRIFRAVGQLKGVSGVDCVFRGETRAIDIRGVHGSVPFAGLLMPMLRPTDRQKPAPEPDAEQIEHEGAEG